MIDYYLVQPFGRPDYAKAEQLAAASGDDEAEYYVAKMLEVLRDGVLDPDDLTERISKSTGDVYVFQDHGGVGDRGSTVIGNSRYIANVHPDIFMALAIRISWSHGTKVLLGQPDGTIW